MSESRDSLLAAARELIKQLRTVQSPMGDEQQILLRTLHTRLRPVFVEAMGGFVVPEFMRPMRLWSSKMWDEASNAVAYLEANTQWQPPRAGPPPANAWVHPRLWNRIEQVLTIASRSADAGDWSTVAREAVVFLEGELRLRTGGGSPGRRQVAVEALNPDGGQFALGDDRGQQTAWMNLASGLLGAVGSAAAHSSGERSETYAMGVVGSVSLLLSALDERYGPPA